MYRIFVRQRKKKAHYARTCYTKYSTFDMIMTKTGSTKYHKNGFAGFQQRLKIQQQWEFQMWRLPAMSEKNYATQVGIYNVYFNNYSSISFIHCKNSLLTPTYSSVIFWYVKIMNYMTLHGLSVGFQNQWRSPLNNKYLSYFLNWPIYLVNP